MNKIYRLIFVICILCALPVAAEEYLVISKDSKVYEEANAHGYAAVNQQDQEVILLPGMAFIISSKSNGWDLIEYSPGLRGWVMESYSANTGLKTPTPGYYNPQNNASQNVSVAEPDGTWTLSVNGHNYSGKLFDSVVVFLDQSGIQSYTLVNLNGQNILIDYNNDVTHYF